MTTRSHLWLVPNHVHHVLLTEVYDDDTAEIACTCGEEWGVMSTAFIPALAEYHRAVIYA